MAEIIAFPRDPYVQRVCRVARWLAGHAGRTERTLAYNLGAEVNRYLAALIVASVPPHIAQQHAEQFRHDVLGRLADIAHANATQPAGDVLTLPVLRWPATAATPRGAA